VSVKVTEVARYGVLLEYWYLIVVAIVIFIGLHIIRGVKGRGYQALLIVIQQFFFLISRRLIWYFRIKEARHSQFLAKLIIL